MNNNVLFRSWKRGIPRLSWCFISAPISLEPHFYIVFRHHADIIILCLCRADMKANEWVARLIDDK